MNSDNLTLASLKKELRSLGNLKGSKGAAVFFKTAPGQYGEGDVFLGINVPNQRKIAQKYQNLALDDLQSLLLEREHEMRFVALAILVLQYRKGNKAEKKRIFSFYLKNTARINNWDLVDASAHQIVGDYLLHFTSEPQTLRLLTKLSKSKLLWERRIAIVATYAFICTGNEKILFTLAPLVFNDPEDLMHKALGWMVRETGKRCSREKLSGFLNKYTPVLPRTALRYALEHYPEKERKQYLQIRRVR